jgi:hypothetical protein
MYIACRTHIVYPIKLLINFSYIMTQFNSVTCYVLMFKVPISLVGPLWIRKERKKLVNEFKRFFWFSAIISKIQASKLPTVPESQAPMHNEQFGKRPNSIAVLKTRRLGIRNSPLFKGLYPQNYCTKSKNLWNLLTNFLRSFQIHKGPTSDIGTLY